MRLTTLSILLAGLLLSAAVAAQGQAPDGEDHRHGEFRDAESWSKIFDDPKRHEWQKTSTVMRLLDVHAGETVADIGAGTGYFTRLLAIGADESGLVYAVDVDPDMLEFIRKRSDMPKIGNVVTVLAEPDDPKLPAGAVDLVLVVNTWHHIEQRVNYLDKIRLALATGGRVVIVDWQKRELPMGPPVDRKLSRETVVQEFEQAGWKLVSESAALPYQYYLSFRPGHP
jgi:ubiquinone/menaquinone biosynthesis C-methylase UbiE